MTNNEEGQSRIESAVIETNDYKNYNKTSCLKGIPLNRLKQSLTALSKRKIDPSQLLGDTQIAFRLHKLQIPTEIESALAKKYPDKQEGHLLNPETWSLSNLSRNMLIHKTKQLIKILEEAIEKARVNETQIDRLSFPDDFALQQVLRVYDKSGDILFGAMTAKTLEEKLLAFQQLTELVNQQGYQVRLLEAGTPIRVIGPKGTVVTEPIGSPNFARIGADNKTVFVAGYPRSNIRNNPVLGGLPIDLPETCHDIGACLLGGKIVDYSPNIPLDIFNQATGNQIPLSVLQELGILTNQQTIPNTWLLDALINQQIPRSMFP